MTFPSERGERWTQYHGDCLEIMPTLPAQSVDLIAADLPYGVVACAWDTVIPFAPLWEAYRHVLKPNGAVVLTSSQPFTSALVMSNPKWFKYEWIWEKPLTTGHLNCKIMPLRGHESILVFAENRVTFNPQLTRKNVSDVRPSSRKGKSQCYGSFGEKELRTIEREESYPRSVIRINNPRFVDSNMNLHPTQKPVSLFAYLIRTYTNPGDTVLDSTSGSGTTGIACLQELRNYIGIEQDETYYRASVERLRCASHQEVMAL